MTVQVSTTNSFDFTFPDTTGTGFAKPLFCGNRVYEFLPHLAAISVSGSSLILKPLLPNEAGTYKVAVNVYL